MIDHSCIDVNIPGIAAACAYISHHDNMSHAVSTYWARHSRYLLGIFHEILQYLEPLEPPPSPSRGPPMDITRKSGDE